jgi:hypothetical protein
MRFVMNVWVRSSHLEQDDTDPSATNQGSDHVAVNVSSHPGEAGTYPGSVPRSYLTTYLTYK